MAVSFDPNGVSIPLGRLAPLIVAQRYNPASGFASLPNVQPIQVQSHEGTPGLARFKYVLSDDPNNVFPDSFADFVPVNASGPYLVKADDRLVVSAISPDTGDATILFDGFAQSPEAFVDGDSGHSATFTAMGTAIREFDGPLGGALYRDGDDPVAGIVTRTSLPVRFNPMDDALPIANATPLGADVPRKDGLTGSYPVFLSPTLTRETSEDDDESEDTEDNDEMAGDDEDSTDDDEAESGDTRRFWTVAMAAQYIVHDGCQNQSNVTIPPFNGAIFQAIAPTGGGAIDANKPSTYTLSDIIVRDLDVSNVPWPEALKMLLWPHGIRFRFDLDQDDNGNPTTTIRFYRLDGMFTIAPKTLALQVPGSPLDPGQSNAATIKAIRDTSEVFNVIVIETDPVLYEVSVILAPGFHVAVGDASNLRYFKKANLGANSVSTDIRNGYRLYIFDELGDGHWDFATNVWVTKPGDSAGLLNKVFGGTFQGDRIYARRYRPGRNEIISTVDGQPAGVPLRSRLDFSRSYSGPVANVWNGQGNWQPIPGGWRLLKNRLGIYVNIEDPNAWDLGDPRPGSGVTLENAGKFLSGVESIAKPVAMGTPNFKTKGLFYLRLTTVIAGDQGIAASAGRRPASPRQFAITSRIDCKEHFRKHVVDTSSPYCPSGGVQVVPRDDTSRALAHARTMRSANEMGRFAVQATIPRLSTVFDVGDRISGLTGVTASFRVNAASQAGEGPTYPVVVGRTWDLDGRQSTTLDLADDRAQPQRA